MHRKLAARVAMMDPQPSRKKFWDEPPLRTMREWYIRNPAKSWGTEYVELAGEPDVLAKHQLTPDGPHKYPLSFQNAGQWLGALEDLLGTIQRGLSGKHTTPQTRRKVPSPRETVDILIAIRDLDFLLRSNLFELLNQHGVGRCLLPPVQRPEDVFQNDDSSERDGQPFEEDHDETEDASLERCPEESRVQHLHRYLQSITTWYTSRRILMSGFKAPARDVMVFQVKANPSRQVTYEDVKTMTDAYMDQLRQHYSSDEVGRATHFLATKGFICKNPDPPAEEKQMMSAKLTEQMAVHAEASMLALVWTARYGSSEEQCGQNLLETYFPNSKNIVLGSSKKCCACCSMLSERLARLHQPDFWRPAPQDTPSFILPGTHAAISPWIPPASGIPTAILKDMRASLFYIFHDLVSTGGEGYMPPVSAPDDEQPKDEDDDEEEEDYYMHALGSLSPCLDDVNSSSTTPTAGG
ncbi:hypothetical protein BC628DRAFT_827413 [Trametes gibbosa]|nr:hypothetical protein BC628DRAFT_827413 [Trametes gibbosa]